MRVPKSSFPTGIAHLILLNAAQQPLNERITFINHNDNLNIEVRPSASTYSTRDSVPVHVIVKDNNGKPVVGSFSMAVTDDSQVKPEGIAEKNIASYFLLSADLKRYLEEPGYYLMNNEEAWRDWMP